MTSGNPPRKHHFVTQSWIKRFSDADGHLLAYCWDKDDVKVRSSKKIMQITDLYTLDPGGIDDTSIETEDLQKVDDDGAKTMSAILAGDRSKTMKRCMAEFLSVQIMRDPQRLLDYSRSAHRFLSRLFIETFSTKNFHEFQTFFGDLVEHSEYNYILSLGSKQAALEIARIQLALEARGGIVELPFTDLIRSPDGRERLRDVLLGLDWTLISASPHSFVLGDQGVLFDPGQLGAGLRVPISNSSALILGPSKSSDTVDINSRLARGYEPSAMNYESAARSRRWIVGAKEAIEKVMSQVTGDLLPER
jgi:hypothetical protein